MWECEAFGIPDVDYEWLRNSEPLRVDMLTEDEKNRYELVVSTKAWHETRFGGVGIMYFQKLLSFTNTFTRLNFTEGKGAFFYCIFSSFSDLLEDVNY